MEHREPTENRLTPEAFARFFDADQERRRLQDELMRELPYPKNAPELFARVMADEVRRDFMENLLHGRDIDPVTGRMIAYSLIKYAPDDTPVRALTTYYRSGRGSRDELRAEYLPLYQSEQMEPEGRLLLDILGTHLYRREHPDRGQQPRHYPVRATLLTVTNRAEQTLLHFPMQYGRSLADDDVEPVAAEMCHHVRVKGDPFLAYLRLPGIDAASSDLLHRFELAYQGVAGQDVDADGLHRGPDEMFGQHEPSWEAVEIGGQVHVFYH